MPAKPFPARFTVATREVDLPDNALSHPVRRAFRNCPDELVARHAAEIHITAQELHIGVANPGNGHTDDRRSGLEPRSAAFDYTSLRPVPMQSQHHFSLTTESHLAKTLAASKTEFSHNEAKMKIVASAVTSCVVFAFLLGLSTACRAALATTELDGVIAQATELPKGWSFVRSLYSVSFTASDFYENYQPTYASEVGAKLEAKRFQSFAGPGRGTVFYLHFDNPESAKHAESFSRSLIWEGDEPSPEHPERIFVVGKTLVIVSCPHEQMTEQLERLLRSKTEAASGH
jgi:hypothetical protein